MPRSARLVTVGYPHHITQMGNYGQIIFTKTAEYRRDLKWLDKYEKKYRLLILAYCLMPNHVHFIAVSYTEDSFARTFNVCHMRYAQCFNNKKITRAFANTNIRNVYNMLDMGDISEYIDVSNWKEYLSQNTDECFIIKIRFNTLRGKPLGSDIFTAVGKNVLEKKIISLLRGRLKIVEK
jgi:REP element-mobilizing transposase RayT